MRSASSATSGPSPAGWAPATRTGSSSPREADLPAATTGAALAALPGWASDDHAAALSAYRSNPRSVPALPPGPARAAFESAFRPGTTVAGHLTGYYEPELDAAPVRSAAFLVPLHAMPPGGTRVPRAAADAALAGHEIAWLRCPVDRFMLQVQGSGRLRMAGGGVLRVGYAGTNGHPYRSIGRMLVAAGALAPGLTAARLADWLRADPARGRAAMDGNPSYVLFRTLDAPDGEGPPGTLCPVTTGRSIAVDPDHIPLGTPVWVEGPGWARLCVAQDTGSAIRGAGRVDLFCGTGDAAGREAGALDHPCRVTPLVAR